MFGSLHILFIGPRLFHGTGFSLGGLREGHRVRRERASKVAQDPDTIFLRPCVSIVGPKVPYPPFS